MMWIALILLQTSIKVVRVTAAQPNCAINDDYCDCGHDEMRSSACSFYQTGRMFQCSDTRFFNQSLFLSRVGDGVCDCCDGSDEIYSKNPIKCPNMCSEMGENFKLELKKLDEANAKGSAEREIILRDEKSRFDDLRSSMARAQKLIPQYKRMITNYRSELIGQQSLEKMEFNQIYAASKAAFSQSLQMFSGENLRRILAIVTLRCGDTGVEAILVESDGKYDTDSREPDDLSAFALVAEDTCPVTSGVDEELSFRSKYALIQPPSESISKMMTALSLDQLSMDTLVELCSYAIPRALEHRLPLLDCFLQAGATLPSIDFLDSLPSSPVVVKTNGHKRPEAEALRTKILDLTSQIATQKEHAVNFHALGNITYGPNNSLFSLRDKCFSSEFKEHRYEICPFKEAKQGGILIGTFERVEIEVTSSLDSVRVDGIEVDERYPRESIYLYFTNGEVCHGPQRHRDLILKIECGSGDAVISEIREPELCSYRATLASPLGCL
jgi:protein kinase C substrate 80K-H